MENLNTKLFKSFLHVFEPQKEYFVRSHVDDGVEIYISFPSEPVEEDFKPLINGYLTGDYSEVEFPNSTSVLAVYPDRVEVHLITWDSLTEKLTESITLGSEVESTLYEAYIKLTNNKIRFLLNG